tara:strand:- start:1921 stop:3345 length:1425 start_codon:yes stop_codon:yes gene_type:complete
MSYPSLAHRPKDFVRKPRKIYLSQEDFENPVSITTPDTLVLFTSNVIVDFKKPPLKESPTHLGHFAALIIGAPRVVIDLQGHTLQMSEDYSRRQRFFSLIELDTTPFPNGTGKFTTPPVRPTDVTVKNGRLGLTSHFALHNSTGGARFLFQNLAIEAFEVGAIALSSCHDVAIDKLTIGKSIPPKTTGRFVMLRDLYQSLLQEGTSVTLLNEIRESTDAEQLVKPESSDALVRSIVIVPHFNVGGVPATIETRIHRITVTNVTFDDLFAAPQAVTGQSTSDSDEDVIKDANGNLISLEDSNPGSDISQAQAFISRELPTRIRQALLNKQVIKLRAVPNLDVRGHDLRQKASTFIRIDGATDVLLAHVTAKCVHSTGESGAATCFTLNHCNRATVYDVNLKDDVYVGGGAIDPFNDQRPMGGLYIRNCNQVQLDKVRYPAGKHCSAMMVNVNDVHLKRSTLKAPIALLQCKNVTM